MEIEKKLKKLNEQLDEADKLYSSYCYKLEELLNMHPDYNYSTEEIEHIKKLTDNIQELVNDKIKPIVNFIKLYK